jgi:hypothetical protein
MACDYIGRAIRTLDAEGLAAVRSQYSFGPGEASRGR